MLHRSENLREPEKIAGGLPEVAGVNAIRITGYGGCPRDHARCHDLRAARIIEDWALGGALAAIYYVEPFTTYDADIFFIPSDKGLTPGVPAIYEHLQARGWKLERGHLLIQGFPVQFLAAAGLTEEAVREAEAIKFEGVLAKVFCPEHIIAIAASVWRSKDKARIERLLQQANLDESRLKAILERYHLTLPKS